MSENIATEISEIKVEETTNEIKQSTLSQENKAEFNRNEIISRRKEKKALRIAKYEESKKSRRLQERQKQKAKRKAEVKLGIIGPGKRRKQLKNNKIDNSSNSVRVAIDFNYDELMSEKDIGKCSKQLLRVYTENRKSSMPIRLYYTSIREGSKIENALNKHDGYKHWDVKIQQESYLDLFEHDSIVYLTSESDNVLQEIDPNAVYIIGGLIDHNHHKGLSLQKANQNALKTARLPLAEHITIKTRTVLTIVHGKYFFFFENNSFNRRVLIRYFYLFSVFEILLKVSEGKPWKDVLLEVLPQRKFKIPNNPNKSSKNNSSKDKNADNNTLDDIKVNDLNKNDESGANDATKVEIEATNELDKNE